MNEFPANTSTITFGAAIPNRWGRVLEVIPSPTTPVSSPGKRPSVGAVVGPWVSIVIVKGALSVVPFALVARTRNVYVPSARGPYGRMKLPEESLVVVLTGSPLTAPPITLKRDTWMFGSVTPISCPLTTLVTSAPPDESLAGSSTRVGVLGGWGPVGLAPWKSIVSCWTFPWVPDRSV